MDDVAVLERLVPATEVLQMLAREHDRRGNYANFDVCLQVALETLLARLRDGHLDAWTTTCGIDSSIDTGSVTLESIVSPWDYYRHRGFPKLIPVEFWGHYHYAKENNRSIDLVAGDFRFSYVDDSYSSRDGYAYEVFFDPRGLPAGSVPSWHGPALTSKPVVPEVMSSPSNKGRKPANWWPDFAEELAFFIHDRGMPETQEALISGVQAAMVAAGKEEPSRSQIQPVIRSVFARWKSAGN